LEFGEELRDPLNSDSAEVAHGEEVGVARHDDLGTRRNGALQNLVVVSDVPPILSSVFV